MTADITFTWITSIASITQSEWDSCYDEGNVVNCYDLTRTLEGANFADTQFHYLLGRQDGELKLALPCFLYHTHLDVIAAPALGKFCSWVRKFFPNFFCLRALIAGSPIAICTDSFGIAKIKDSELDTVLTQVKHALTDKAKELKCQLVVLKELEEQKLTRLGNPFKPEFMFVPSMPCAYIELPKGAPHYAERLRSDYRSKYSRRIKKSQEAGICWRMVTDFSNLAEDLHKLYSQVLQRSASNFNALTPDLFRQLGFNLRDRCFVQIAKRDEKILSFALVLTNANDLYPLYLGLDYAFRDEGALYYNTCYKLIEEAERRDNSSLFLGQTAYHPKASLGARFRKLYLAIQPLTKCMAVVIGAFATILFPEITPPQFNVFKVERASPSLAPNCLD
ncbi:MAG: GNAT family N-acetyltransferase [Deltaproteobacteria bacterium]|nr:GNAT family N-acetyltransferase [Deltaproteobacteria bacterium]